jgi:hypothetical protein
MKLLTTLSLLLFPFPSYWAQYILQPVVLEHLIYVLPLDCKTVYQR